MDQLRSARGRGVVGNEPLASFGFLVFVFVLASLSSFGRMELWERTLGLFVPPSILYSFVRLGAFSAAWSCGRGASGCLWLPRCLYTRQRRVIDETSFGYVGVSFTARSAEVQHGICSLERHVIVGT